MVHLSVILFSNKMRKERSCREPGLAVSTTKEPQTHSCRRDMSVGGIVWSMPPGGARTGIGYVCAANITVASGAAPGIGYVCAANNTAAIGAATSRGQNARQHTSGFGAAVGGPTMSAVSIAGIQRGFVRTAQLHAPRSIRGLMNMLMSCASFTWLFPLPIFILCLHIFHRRPAAAQVNSGVVTCRLEQTSSVCTVDGLKQHVLNAKSEQNVSVHFILTKQTRQFLPLKR